MHGPVEYDPRITVRDYIKVVDTTQPNTRTVLLNTITASSFAGREIVPRPWLVKDWIPGANISLLYGDGGTGKSLVALQLGVAVALGSDWLGTMLEPGPVLYVSCEDDEYEIRLRLEDILAAQNRHMNELTNFDIVDLAGEDAVLGSPARSGGLEATPLWAAISAKIEEMRPKLVIIDTAADTFGGNEISRVEVRQFMTMLRKVARRSEVTILVLAHPSVSGMASGTGTSGSTAWSNSSRGRLYLERPRAEEDGTESDPDLRILRLMKANNARIGTEIRLRWQKGCFKPEAGGLGTFDRAAKEAKSDAAFVKLLRRFADEKREVSDKKSPSYAPSLFSKQPDSEGCSKGDFEHAMHRLLSTKKVVVEPYGPPSRRYSKLILAGDQ